MGGPQLRLRHDRNAHAPGATSAWMLFCVTTRGRDRIFSKPRDSASVRTVSIRTLLLALMKLRPLVGLVTWQVREQRNDLSGCRSPGRDNSGSGRW